MKTVKIWNQNCILAGRVCRDHHANDNDVTEYDLESARAAVVAGIREGGPNGNYKVQAGREAIGFLTDL